MDFPDSFLRGISDKNHIQEDGEVSSAAFNFGEKNNLPDRQDDNHEESIFWEDDDGAIKLLLSQTKEDDKIQFRAGAALVDRHAVDLVIKLPYVKSQLAYERNATETNPYHGNLLLKKSVNKSKMRRIAAAIALCCFDHIPQN